MGDARAYVKIEFSIYGKDFKKSWDINWFAGEGQVDERIEDWFRACHAEAHYEFLEDVRADQRKREAEDAERRERAELARLQAKYSQTGEPE